VRSDFVVLFVVYHTVVVTEISTHLEVCLMFDLNCVSAQHAQLCLERTIKMMMLMMMMMMMMMMATVDDDYVKFVEKLENAEPEVIPTPEVFLEEIEARERLAKGDMDTMSLCVIVWLRYLFSSSMFSNVVTQRNLPHSLSLLSRFYI